MSLTAALSFPPAPVPPLPPSSSWSRWRAHFERNRPRPLPPTAEAVDLPPAIASELARSLARFQIGETGEGRIVGAVARSRLAGIRCKLLVMFAAEVVGAGFYRELAARLPPGAMRSALEQIAGDEQAHLRFHRQFFAIQAWGRWRRLLFLAAWFPLAHAASLVVLWDHRHTLRALTIPRREISARLSVLVLEGAR